MNSTYKAIRIMKLVRIIAAVLIVAAIVLYFTAKEYALYPAAVGFILVALINIPLNIWLAFKREKERKEEIAKYEAGRKDPADKTDRTDDPIRYENRKSGLRWGGGNVHAANAERKTRKKFLR
jgi:hypothetical protein